MNDWTGTSGVPLKLSVSVSVIDRGPRARGLDLGLTWILVGFGFARYWPQDLLGEHSDLITSSRYVYSGRVSSLWSLAMWTGEGELSSRGVSISMRPEYMQQKDTVAMARTSTSPRTPRT